MARYNNLFSRLIKQGYRQGYQQSTLQEQLEGLDKFGFINFRNVNFAYDNANNYLNSLDAENFMNILKNVNKFNINKIKEEITNKNYNRFNAYKEVLKNPSKYFHRTSTSNGISNSDKKNHKEREINNLKKISEIER